MILIHGEIRENKDQLPIIKALRPDLYKTLARCDFPRPETVIAACDKLQKRVLSGEFDAIVRPLLDQFDITYDRFREMARLFSAEALREKCRIELSDLHDLADAPATIGHPATGIARRTRYPLGILLHIAAGNIDGLPAYSVVEGLLTGNINLLKLPAGDSGLSVKLLSELIACEPTLSDYIYVFDVPSTETETLKLLADLADAVVVWGGDVAVRAARALVDVDTRIISWGHKLSFAYATPDCSDDDLCALARHICETGQVLCSSCQGIFLDTDDRETQLAFAERFYHILRAESDRSRPVDFGMRAKNAIHIYNERLEAHETGHTIFAGGGVSVIATDDRNLALSYMFRNTWVKRLPRAALIEAIKPHKDHLQTVGLLCTAADRPALTDTLARAGLVRITRAGDLSRMTIGEAHDGTYPLRLYSRIVEFD